HGPGKKIAEETDALEDPKRIAIYPLAVPYLLNPVGITVLIIASAEVVSVASVALVVALVLLVGAFDYAIFANIDKVAKRLRPTSLVISEVVFGILLTAVAVQLVVAGLNFLGIIATPGAAHSARHVPTRKGALMAAKDEPPRDPVRRWTLIILAAIVALSLYSIIADRMTPYTSQATVQAFIVRMAPEVSGRVQGVLVTDNQKVKAGDILFRIDPQTYEIALKQADARLASVGH